MLANAEFRSIIDHPVLCCDPHNKRKSGILTPRPQVDRSVVRCQCRNLAACNSRFNLGVGYSGIIRTRNSERAKHKYRQSMTVAEMEGEIDKSLAKSDRWH